MIVLIIVILLLLSACKDWTDAEDWERSERNAERRHKETVNALRSKGTTRITRTIARDEIGRIIAQEVTEDSIPDLDEISEEDYEYKA